MRSRLRTAMDPDFRARLRRLRRDEESERAPHAALPLSLQRRLARASGAANGDGCGSDADEPGPFARAGEAPADLIASETAAGLVFARSRCYAAKHRHGAWQLAEAAAANAADFALLTGDRTLGELDLRRALFLDTETTGLSGGAGTYVFLVGLGAFTDAGFELWQGFLRDPGEERALLAACADRIRASAAVVSFFGKAFDRHRLEDRMRVHGIAPPFAAVPHLDLCHPLRRLYRGVYEDGRLRTLERELCGVEREDDLPGSLAPAAWFDYLSGRPHRLEGVFRHNADDVLSLVTLAAHLGRSSADERVEGTALSGDATSRGQGIARSLLKQRRRAEAQAGLERFVSQRTPL